MSIEDKLDRLDEIALHSEGVIDTISGEVFRIFEEIVSERLAAGLINGCLLDLAKNARSGLHRTNRDNALLWNNSAFALRACYQTHNRPRFDFAPIEMIHGNIGANVACLELFELPANFEWNKFKPEKLNPAGIREIQPGEVILIDSRNILADFNINTFGPALTLTLEVAPFEHFTRAFSRSDLSSQSISLFRTSDINIDAFLPVIRQAKQVAKVDDFIALTDHPVHSLRWAAIQAVYDFDEARGIDLAQRAAKEDPHGEVRHAALESLKFLSASGVIC